ncbi:hypothetical protein, partial [Pseudomonas putida]|uniref:hypothetical protein n=1 Tax=Pseudomonas putida TaxID=303 RepID=UPI0030822583
MDIYALRQKSIALRVIIDRLKSHDPAAMKLSVELTLLLNAAKQQRIRTPMEWRDIPGSYLFTEEGLQQYADLEHAFAEFRIELSGGESPTVRDPSSPHSNRPPDSRCCAPDFFLEPAR